MFDVQTDHQIVMFGTDIMQLLDRATGRTIVTARRENEVWTLTGDAIPDVIVATGRSDAITAMTDDLALKVLGGSGYSTLVPHGLMGMP